MEPQGLIVQGSAWLLGDNINAESILMSGEEERRDKVIEHVLEFYEPAFAKEVQPGDVIITGKNFGASSGRPAGEILRQVGVGAVVCESSGIVFYRNTWNIGLPVFQCQDITGKFKKGDQIKVNILEGIIENSETGEQFLAEPTPPILLEIFQSGGLIKWIKGRRHLYKTLY